jgi:UDP-glucose 4-epimerase
MLSGGENATMDRTVVVTGGAGFVGSRAVELLADSVKRVIALDVVESPRARELVDLPNVEFRTADLRDLETVEPIVAESDVIVHLAAVRTQASRSRPKDAHDINVGSTYDLLSLASRHGVRRFVFSSSNTVYGSYQDPHAPPFREDHPWVCRGVNMYAATKLAGEAYLEAFAGSGGPEYLALRIGPVYGPRVTPDSNGASMVHVLRALDEGKRPPVSWTKDSLLSFVYVDDVAKAIVASLNATQMRVAVNVVGEAATAEQVYSRLAELYGYDPGLLDWKGERIRYQLVSQERMKEVLGFTPETSLDDGLRALIDWHRGQS